MMHYTKGANIEKEIKKEELPFDDCFPSGKHDFLWMQVKGGTKVSNVVNFAKNALDKGEYRTIVWTGAGGGLVKTVSCAEIIKRSHPLYQVTRMCYNSIEEHWLPQMEGLDEIVVNRKIPCLHILMSLDEIDESIKGLQKPNTQTSFFGDTNLTASSNRHASRLNTRGSGGDSHKSNQNRKQNYAKNDQATTKYNKSQSEKQNKGLQDGQRKKNPQNNAKSNQSDNKQVSKQDCDKKTSEESNSMDVDSKSP